MFQIIAVKICDLKCLEHLSFTLQTIELVMMEESIRFMKIFIPDRYDKI